MADQTAISWTDATWNPWRGCTKVSPGCASCYMFRDQRRYGRDPDVVVRAGRQTFRAPVSMRWYKPRLIFTCSWSDFFHPAADAWRDDAWAIIREADHHTFQILTKRPERIAEHLPADWGDGYANVWLGVSVENQRFVHRIATLNEVPAALRFVSAEPLLGPLDLSAGGYDWLIVGGESGGRPGHPPRPMKAEWVQSLRDQAAECDVPFHLKQWGGPRPGGEALLDGREWRQRPNLPSLAAATIS